MASEIRTVEGLQLVGHEGNLVAVLQENLAALADDFSVNKSSICAIWSSN